jgi:serine/threonine-protein kinase
MSKRNPWEEYWTIQKELGKGGQGTTYLVKGVKKNILGVLKILKNQKNDQARRRMHKEVTNLKILFNANCKVPKVLDGNTEDFELKTTKLFFVMEYIKGKNLLEFIESGSDLGLDKTGEIMFDLISSIEKAHKEGILHRDIKPENIIVRDIRKPEIIIVDYGLSFNAQDEDNLTKTNEMLDNRFLSLPERRVPGGDRRDQRSDITGLCGIFFFLIFKEFPVDLSDERGRLPHRRSGKELEDILEGDKRFSNLESFFDKAFLVDITARFQTIDELRNRLQEVIDPVAIRNTKDPFEFALMARKRYFEKNRPTQLQNFKEKGQKLIELFKTNIITKYQDPKLKPFAIGGGSFSGPTSNLEGDSLQLIWSYEVVGINKEIRNKVKFFSGIGNVLLGTTG